MAKIAALIGNMFEDSEYMKPAKTFKDAKHELINIGSKKGQVRGLKRRRPVKIEKKAIDVSPENFDALFIPGGYSPDQLRSNDDVVSFVKNFAKSGKPILCLCEGAQLLITADVIRGRKVTGWKSIIADIKNAGAEFVDQEVVEDGNILSSGNPSDIPAFINASLAKLSTAPKTF
jgi:protease I